MQITTNFNKLNIPSSTTVAIGSFDGVHLAHQAIINKLLHLSKTHNLIPYVFFFEPLPKEFFMKDKAPSRIYDFRNKVINIIDSGVDNIICQKFNQEFANIEAETFIENYLVKKLKVKHIIVGDDFKFGKNREGDCDLLKKLSSKYGYTVDILSTLLAGDNRISSSRIRKAIADNDIDKATDLLGKPLKVNSRIIHGQKNGRKIGFHTANQKLLKNSVLKGVYLTKTYIDNKTYYGITNAGTRPTIDGKNKLLETHIFDFNEYIYSKHITVEILDFIRPEKKFDSFDELKNQIELDIKTAKKQISSL